MLPKTLLIVRHGQSESNLVQKDLQPAPSGFYDRHDSHARLSALGVLQARSAGKWIRDNGYNVDRQYVSPFIRTLETAYNLGLGDSWVIDDLWRERDWGVYGLTPNNLQVQKFPDTTRIKELQSWYWKPDGGESLATGARSRVNSIMTHLYRMNKNIDTVVATSHGELMSVIQFVIEKMTPTEFVERERMKEYTIRNANIMEYTRVNPETGEEHPQFKWRRITCPWDETLSHDGGKWVELPSKRYSNTDLKAMYETYDNLFK